MKINITRQEENLIEMNFSGEGHTLLNLLQSTLLEDANVEMAGYTKPHPLMDKSTFFIRLKKKEDPLEVLKRASKNTDKKLEDFVKGFINSIQNLKE